MKKIGIGYEDYKRVIDDNTYYIDKTMLISDIVEKGGMVTLFTRPRRFGKTLALSMLRTFFELEYDSKGSPVDKKRYFEGKRIMGASEEILSMMGKYPVIRLSLKSAKQLDFKTAFKALRGEIKYEFIRHDYVMNANKLSGEEKAMFKNLSMGIADEDFLNREKYEFEVGRYATALKEIP